MATRPPQRRPFRSATRSCLRLLPVRVRAGERHWPNFRGLVEQHGLRGNDIPDAYLAALALEQGATWVTTDRGFARYEGLRLLDPLATRAWQRITRSRHHC